MAELRDFYYSAKQAEISFQFPTYIDNAGYGHWRTGFNKAKLENGKIVNYTETVDVGEEPSGNWDDYEYLGRGVIYSVASTPRRM